MKKIFLFFTLFTFFACDRNSNPEKEAKNKKALNAILAEPKVKDATITDANVLYAAVADDGTRRDGYAEYLCTILKSAGSTANRVKIVRVNSSKDPNRDNAYGVLLGESSCN